MIAFAVVGGLLGLATLFLPRSLMLFGERWTLKDGARAEPSDAYVVYVRVLGAGILIATAVITLWIWSNERAQARSAELEELWDVTLHSDDEVKVVADPRVVTVTGTAGPLRDRQVLLWPTRSAVVGRDELGDLGDISSFEDGDLLVGMGYSACTFSHLLVTHDGGETTVGIVVELPEVSPLPPVPGVPTSSPAAPSPADSYRDIEFCTRRFGIGDDVGLTVFRVPDAR